ncbi:MAG: peptidoglycan DD-metalloendopeptidase family protein [Bacteroidales bacterium]|nr:LysM peptidoglycan-binding domain-containing protein [Bacteroidales bacterium]MBR3608405.1 peptidoglycan DD-metalloendopeptidase family protein [Bacteroidales bacterium]
MIKSVKIVMLILMVAVMHVGLSYAQPTRLNAQEHHALMQQNLIAYNKLIPQIMNVVDSSLVLNQLLNKESDLDAMMADGWDEQWLETYSTKNPKDTFAIDVKEHCIPVPGHVTSAYGWRWGRMHKGIDLKLYVGDTVRAAFTGKISTTAYQARGYGYYVKIRHINGLETVYGHLSRILVKPNQVVKAGDPIALGGNTGRSTGPHLHFETKLMGMTINPAEIFDFKNQVAHTDTYMFYKKKQQNSAVNSYATHRIKSGESLSTIARKYRTTVTQLCRLNGIKSNKILRVGSVIRVR